MRISFDYKLFLYLMLTCFIYVLVHKQKFYCIFPIFERNHCPHVYRNGSQNLTRLQMSPLRAAGLLIYRKCQGEIQYLFMQTSYGKHHWTPPKGHVDPGENDEDTALRETREEAGLDGEHLSIIEDFRKELKYNVKNKEKTVVYWLAELKNPETPVKMSDEHQDYKWLKYSDAHEFAQWPDMQKLLKEADQFLKDRE